jgi:SAM-dependent methyltransferase
MKPISQAQVWQKQALQWELVGAPLRPSAKDAALMRAAVLRRHGQNAQGLQVAVLGVTPELVGLNWPEASKIRAFDHSADMVGRVWQPHATLASEVCLADWSDLPLPSHSVDVCVGDNALGALPSFAKCRDVLRELERALKPSGTLCLRCFIAPEVPESLADICDDVAQGKVFSFHALKWRLAMALSTGHDQNVVVHRIFQCFQSLFPDRFALERVTGWPQSVINTIDVYRDSDTLYTFFTLAALERLALPWFKVQDIEYPDYELAGRCPTLTLVPRSGIAQ